MAEIKYDSRFLVDSRTYVFGLEALGFLLGCRCSSD